MQPYATIVSLIPDFCRQHTYVFAAEPLITFVRDSERVLTLTQTNDIILYADNEREGV